MRISFYADEHFPGPIIRGLQNRGIDVLTVQEDGRAGQDDLVVLQRATEIRRILISTDEDFFRIGAREQAAGRSFSGIMSVPASLSYRSVIDDLEMLAKCTDSSEWEGLITRLPF